MEKEKKSVWQCPVCKNEETSKERPQICHICGAPGERLEKIETDGKK